MLKPDAQALVDDVHNWFHSIRIQDDVVTPGKKAEDVLQKEWARLGITDLQGKRVLDIGAWDGFFSFQAERAGATVTALDHFVWGVDWARLHDSAALPTIDKQESSVFSLNRLPGKVGFDTARKLLNSNVNEYVGDFMSCDLNEVGVYDIVFYFGVLYHMQHPMVALGRVREVTGEYALIETEAAYFEGFEHVAMCEFFGADELNGDHTNWWAPNMKALVDMCKAVGFRQVDVLSGRKPRLALQRLAPHNQARYLIGQQKPRRYRATVRACV